MYGKPVKHDWVARVVFLIQILPTFSSHCNRYFCDIQLKIYRLLNLNLCSFNFHEQNFPKVNYFDYMTNLIAKGLFDWPGAIKFYIIIFINCCVQFYCTWSNPSTMAALYTVHDWFTCRAQWSLAPNFCSRATRKSYFFHTNHNFAGLPSRCYLNAPQWVPCH